MAARVRAGGPSQVLVFEPAALVLSAGRRSQRAALLEPLRREAASRGVALVLDDRGGEVTFHGPGQIVALLAVAMPKEQIGVLVDALLDGLDAVARSEGLRPERRGGGDLGLWVGDAKLASVGLRHRNGVALHGVSINAAVPPRLVAGLTLCGRPTELVASLHPTGATAAADRVAARLAVTLASSIAGVATRQG